MTPQYYRPDLVYPQLAVPHELEQHNIWLVRSLNDEVNRRAKSGLVYDDDIDSHYSYSDKVPNCKQVAPGDWLLVRDEQMLLGAAVIESISMVSAPVERLRCPRCNGTRLYWRMTSEDYRCDGVCAAQLTGDQRSTKVPVVSVENGVSYRAEFGDTWSDLAGSMLASEFPQLSDRWNRQNSIVKLNPAKVLRFFDQLNFSTRRQVEAVLTDSEVALRGGFAERTVRTRRGQAQFRAHLIRKFGAQCAFTGPCYIAALDAAHLYSYASTGEHVADGGLLLRRDVHRLFDMGLMGVDNTQRISLHRDLVTTQYSLLHGSPLQAEIGEKEKALLSRHFEEHARDLAPV